MNPIVHPKETRSLGKPRDWNPKTMGECGYLSIHDEEGPVHRLLSLWKPSSKELEALNQGACVELGICGHSHPAVSIGVQFPEGLINEPN